MTFSEYALGLSPFISFGKSEHDYFTELVGNFVKDAAMDSCQMLKRQPDTKYRYIKGSRPIQQKDAQYLYDYRDLDKFSKWIWDRMDDSDSYDNVVDWLGKHDIADDDPSTACAKLLENILLDIINGSSMPQIAKESEIDLELIDEIQQKIKRLKMSKSMLANYIWHMEMLKAWTLFQGMTYLVFRIMPRILMIAVLTFMLLKLYDAV